VDISRWQKSYNHNWRFSSEAKEVAMKKALVLIFSLLAAAAAAAAYWGPVQKYTVYCERMTDVVCTLVQADNFGRKGQHLRFSQEVTATVHVIPARMRKSEDVYLYLTTKDKQIFAAAFYGPERHEEASDAAANLNLVFTKAAPQARVEVEAPTYLSWMTWGGIALLVGFIIIIYRELNPKIAKNKPGVPVPK
jgi:hypothetical protein